MTADSLLRDIMRREGGFVDHPADRGGPTNFGITAVTLGDWRRLGRPATADEVRAMSEDEALEIYRSRYVRPFSAVGDERLHALLVDSAVHSGVVTAIRWLQEALNVPADGILGDKTRTALARADAERIYMRVLAVRLRHLGRLITRRPEQAVFAAGWMDRVAGFL